MIKILVQTEENAEMPFYASEEASGADVHAHILKPLIILPRKSALVPTGLSLEIPKGYEIQVRPRSGLALKSQITILNTPGTIDSDYRGEIKIILINHGDENFIVQPGMRIAQLAQTARAHFVKIEALTESVRGAGGFGHTGI
jgi:dUTP pyrophosphatase